MSRTKKSYSLNNKTINMIKEVAVNEDINESEAIEYFFNEYIRLYLSQYKERDKERENREQRALAYDLKVKVK